jgi:oligopeptide/dipeptide ABC transporter ATP-binding protein
LDGGIILVTHDVGVVSEVCDRVVVMYAGRIVESGPTEQVFRSPQHPYTKGLLASTLDLSSSRDGNLSAIPGLPPDLISLPPGCYFWPRCKECKERCKLEKPNLREAGVDHWFACF